MRTILKNHEPGSLHQHRKQLFSSYANYPDKADLRRVLALEQRGLCCYCMGRIVPEHGHMRIEHWHAISRFPNEQLIYANLLGACNGNGDQPKDSQHCDSYKGNRELKWNPAHLARQIENWIEYLPDGRIRSVDPEFDAQLEEVLNLNLPELRNRRLGKLDGILEWLRYEERRSRGPIKPSELVTKRAALLVASGSLEPYCQVEIWWLEQKIRRLMA